MLVKRLTILYIIAIIALSSVSLHVNSQANEPTAWDKNWKYRQEITLPISTDDKHAKFQPIDVELTFKNSCWGKDEDENSIRVVVWSGNKWHELESQVYDITKCETDFIEKCGVVFLTPNFADGKERYFVYYDDSEKPSTSYPDHVSIEEAYYYFEPIPGLSVEGEYYKITEGDYAIFGIGQKGKVIYRQLSNNIMKMKPNSKEFSILNIENTVSLCFTYYESKDEKDEISSDQKLVSREILADGNLMLECKIVSESFNGKIRSSNVYKYYYCPTEDKKISVHVEHQVFEDLTVKGVLNTDGRYGGMISFQSKSERIEKMRFGEILPFLHIYDENNKIKEYQMNLDPEDTDREEIIPYTDDCDLGSEAWLSYDEGESGKAHGIIFSSNTGIVKSGRMERDGIQVKATEKEYLDALGSEIDYAAINFGRNSYEKGGSVDREIPSDLFVELDLEYYYVPEGGYLEIAEESKIFQSLIKNRHNHESDSEPGGDSENIYTLKVTPRLVGRIFSHPKISQLTGFNLSNVFAELYKDGKLVSKAHATKPVIGAPVILFPRLSKGRYIVKVFREKASDEISFIAFKEAIVEEDTRVDILCTWPKDIVVSVSDQNSKRVEGVELSIFRNSSLVDSSVTSKNNNTILQIPFNFYYHNLNATYKGFKLYETEIPILPFFKKEVDISLNLYDIIINVFDELNMPPGVDIKLTLTSKKMDEAFEIQPEEISNGNYLFENLPEAIYELHVSYGGYSEFYTIKIPDEIPEKNVLFNAKYDLEASIYDSRGNPVDCCDKTISISRDGKRILEDISADETVTIPPGQYTVYVYNNERLIGLKNIVLSNDKKINVATTTNPIYPTLVLVLVSIFIIQIVVLLFFKKISLNSFMKLFAMSLILLSLVLPWWSLSAQDTTFNAEKSIQLYLVPGSMMESIHYNNNNYLDIANIPEIFTNFLGVLLIIVTAGFVLLGFSFIPNILYKRRFYKILISASIIFLLLVAGAFWFGMAQITELSLGGLQGSGTLQVMLPAKSIAYMDSSWGLDIGFYLSIIAALMALAGGLIDYLKKKKIF